MNVSTFILKLITEPEPFVLSPQISFVKAQGQIGSSNPNFFDVVEVYTWGTLGHRFYTYFRKNDYIIIQGSLSLRKEVVNNKYQKRIRLTVQKVYPYILDESLNEDLV